MMSADAKVDVKQQEIKEYVSFIRLIWDHFTFLDCVDIWRFSSSIF